MYPTLTEIVTTLRDHVQSSELFVKRQSFLEVLAVVENGLLNQQYDSRDTKIIQCINLEGKQLYCFTGCLLNKTNFWTTLYLTNTPGETEVYKDLYETISLTISIELLYSLSGKKQHPSHQRHINILTLGDVFQPADQEHQTGANILSMRHGQLTVTFAEGVFEKVC